MWKVRKEEEERPAAPAGREAAPAPFPSSTIPPVQENRTVETPKFSSSAVAHIGKSVVIKGQLSGSEDLYLDGEVEGSIDLAGHGLTIGPNGRIRAQIVAKNVTVHGKVDGNISGERVELMKSAIVVSEITTQRIVIEDGAFFKGSIDIQREAQKAEAPKPQASSVAVGATAPSSSMETRK